MRARAPRLAAATAALTAAMLVAPLVVPPGATPLVGGGTASAEADIDLRIDAPGPLGPITILGDSVLSGSGYAPSTLPSVLADHGWGPIRFRAGLGYSAGNLLPASRQTFSTAYWIRLWRSQGWDAPNVVINLGNNDVGFCRADVACNATAIRYLLDEIGPGHLVWWSKITRLYTQRADMDAYNAALDLVAAERPDQLRVWDWPAAQAANSVPLAWDGIHLPNLVAYRVRTHLMADAITADLARATHDGADAPLPTGTGAASEYLPLTPERVLDTRLTSQRLSAGGTIRLDLSGEVPAGSSAIAANVTAVDPGAAGFLTAYPCSTGRPLASSGNYTAGISRGAQAVVPLAADGSLCVYSSAAADVVVDLQGAFVADGDRFSPLAPTRLADTRATGRAAVLSLPAPSGASAVALNLTATNATTGGYLTAYPCGTERPVVANVNFAAGDTIGGAAFVPVGADGHVCVSTFGTADVVVDLTGTFAPTGAYAFTPSVPTRTYDTRDGTGGWSGIHGAGQVVDARVAPPEAAAVTGTLTIVEPIGDGYLSAFGCAGVPDTASVNAADGGVVANSVTVGLAAAGRLCVRALTTTHVVFDTTGWWA